MKYPWHAAAGHSQTGMSIAHDDECSISKVGNAKKAALKQRARHL